MTEVIDASFDQMDEAVFDFGQRLAAEGVNYLIPVDEEVRTERELRRKAVSVNAILAEME